MSLPVRSPRNTNGLWAIYKNKLLNTEVHTYMCRDGSVGIATRYGLDGPAIESRWGASFSAHIRTGRGAPPNILNNGYRVFPGGKVAGAWPWPPTPSRAEVKERVEQYLYSHYGPSWPVLVWTVPLPLPLPLPLSFIHTYIWCFTSPGSFVFLC